MQSFFHADNKDTNQTANVQFAESSFESLVGACQKVCFLMITIIA